MVPKDQAVQPLLEGLWSAAASFVSDIALFDVYQGQGLPEGLKSLAFRVVMQDTQRTLADAEVEAAVAGLVGAVRQKFGGDLRG